MWMPHLLESGNYGGVRGEGFLAKTPFLEPPIHDSQELSILANPLWLFFFLSSGAASMGLVVKGSRSFQPDSVQSDSKPVRL